MAFSLPTQRLNIGKQRYYEMPSTRIFGQFNPDNDYQSLSSQESLLKKTGVQAPKQKKTGMNFLQRLGSLLSLGETGNAVYRALYENKNPILTYGEDVVRSVKGFALGEDQYTGEPGKKKYTYADISEKGGITNKWAKGGLGLAGDVLLDPITYLGFGTTAAGKLGATGVTKAGLKAVGKGAAKEATETFAKLATKAGVKSSKGVVQTGAKVFGQTYDDILRNIVQKSIKTGKSAVAKGVLSQPKYLAKSGVKFAGKVIPGTKWTANVAEKIGAKVAGSKIGKPVAKLFWRDPLAAPAGYKALKDLRGSDMTNSLDNLIKTTAKTFKDTNPIERELIGRFMNEKRYNPAIKTLTDAIPLLAPKKQAAIQASRVNTLQNLAQSADGIFKKMFKLEQGTGVKLNKLEDYLPLILKNPEDAKALAAQFPQQGLQLTHGFTKSRQLDLPFSVIEKRGYEPVTDVVELLLKRGKASANAVANQKFLQRASQKFGVPATTNITQEVAVPATKNIAKVERAGQKMGQLERQTAALTDQLADVGQYKEYRDFLEGTLRDWQGYGSGKRPVLVPDAVGEMHPVATRNFGPGLSRLSKEEKIQEARKALGMYGNAETMRLDKLYQGGKLSSSQAQRRIIGLERKLTKNGEKGALLQDLMTLPRERLTDVTLKQISPEYKKLIDKGEDVVIFGPQNVVLPRVIAEDLATDTGKVISDVAANTVLRAYDKALNIWKGSVTSWFPAFHGRNAISNTIQNMADIGLAAVSPKKAVQTLGIMTGKKGFLKTRLGAKLSFDDIRKAMKEHGIERGFFGAEVELEAMKSMKTPLKTTLQQTGRTLDVGRKVGNKVEAFARVQNFISNIARGHSFSEAARHTKQFLFDYDNLSKFEKEIMRRLFPFYTWTRKNIELQIKLMATKPGFIANQMKAIRDLSDSIGGDSTPEDRQYLPDYIAQQLGIKLGKDGDKTKYLAGFGLPIESFAKFGDPMRELYGMSSPLVQAPTELFFDKVPFTGQQLSLDTDGSAFVNFPKKMKDFLEFREIKETQRSGKTKTTYYVNPYKKWLIYKLPVSRFASTYSKATQPGRSDTEKVMNLLTGVKTYNVDLDTQKYWVDKERSDYIVDLLTKLGVMKSDTFYRKPSDAKTKSDKAYRYVGSGKYEKLKNWSPEVMEKALFGQALGNTDYKNRKDWWNYNPRYPGSGN